ncbi:MAG: hypothetical protein V3U24_01875 [Candidatus Neomarinimicrobiota bacterium]
MGSNNSLFRRLIFTTAISLHAVVLGWNLERLASYDSPNHELLDVEIKGHYAYVPAGLGGLNIIDISDPSSPVNVATFYGGGCEFGRLYAWHVVGSYAYGSGRSCGIKVLDVSNPRSPFLVGDYGAGGQSYEHAAGHSLGDGEAFLYAAVHSGGVEVIDISDPSSPILVSRVPTQNAWAVEVSETGEFVYVADGAGGFKVVDVRNSESPRVVGRSETSGTAKDVTAAGSSVFVAVGAWGVDMFDVSDPANPILVANYNTSGYASRVSVSGDLVAVSDWDDVEILRWDESPSLTLAGYKNTGGRVMAINMVDDIVYSAEWRFFHTFKFGPVEGPDIDLSFRNVDFPHTGINSCRDTVITIFNTGLSPLVFEEVDLGHHDYEHNIQMETLQPGEKIEGTITYCATSDQGETNLVIRTNDPDEPQVDVRVEGNSSWGVESGEPAPDFSLDIVNGSGSITLSELRDQIVVVAFFASW